MRISAGLLVVISIVFLIMALGHEKSVQVAK